MASRPPLRQVLASPDAESLARRFLGSFEGQRRDFAVELLDLARANFRLRDDDNIHLGRIEAQLMAAVQEAKYRVEARGQTPSADVHIRQLRKALEDSGYSLAPTEDVASEKADFEIRPRQLIGQPAGPGMASGKARVVLSASDLPEMKNGEILVCDAVDPNMTFVVPLSAGIVERRGGMLIHGAIIAREYGLPCVTGVPDATSLIRTGARVTVDGYLGIVTVAATPEQ
jgi:pyruvate,water dikinase